jgi:hypothetical protein
VAVGSIVVRGRLRPVTDAGVESLMASIAETGVMKDAVDLRLAKDGSLVLIAGGHRVEAARRLGWAEVPAKVWSGVSDDWARIMEIDDNLTGITVDGVAATRLAPGSNNYRSIWVAALTGANGATGDIAITRGGTLTRMIAHYYLVEGPLDITPIDTDTMYSSATTDPLTVSFTGLGSRVADGMLFSLVSGTRVSERDFSFSGDIATHSRRTSTGSASTEIQQISGFVVWDDTATGSVSLGGTKTGGTGSPEFYGAAVVLQRTA